MASRHAAHRRRRRHRRGRDDHAGAAARARLSRRATVRVRTLGREAAGRNDGRGGDAGSARCRRPRSLSLLGRHRGQPRARSARRQRRGRLRRQVRCVPARARDSARRPGGERHPRGRAPGDRRQPELLRDPAHVRAQAAARRRRPRAHPGRHLPVGLRRRRAGDGTAAGADAGGERPAHGLVASTASSSTRRRSCARRRGRSSSCRRCR